MRSIDFPQANMAIAKNQPQYQTLYVRGSGIEMAMTACMELSDEEITEIVKTRKIWFTQITHGRGYAPISMATTSPFTDLGEDIPQPMDENRVSAAVWDVTHYKGTVESGVLDLDKKQIFIGTCANCGEDIDSHYWSTRQCKL